MSKTMKKARILSSESDASIKIKQTQNTNIDLSISPPAQQVNFQPCAMAELATMAPPAALHVSTFNPILEETPQMRCPGEPCIHSTLMDPALIQPQVSALTPMVGASVQKSPQAIAKQSPFQEKSLGADIKENTAQKLPNCIYSNGLPVLSEHNIRYMELPKLRQATTYIPPKYATESVQPRANDEIPKLINDISIIDELKRPEEMLPNQPSIKKAQEEEHEHERLQELLREKTKRAEILESMLDVYENKHQMVNGLLTCRQKQLEQLIHAYCGAEKIELIIEPINCGCTGNSQKLIDIESILVTLKGKTIDFRYGFNDAYADMVRHGINLKQILA